MHVHKLTTCVNIITLPDYVKLIFGHSNVPVTIPVLYNYNHVISCSYELITIPVLYYYKHVVSRSYKFTSYTLSLKLYVLNRRNAGGQRQRWTYTRAQGYYVLSNRGATFGGRPCFFWVYDILWVYDFSDEDFSHFYKEEIQETFCIYVTHAEGLSCVLGVRFSFNAVFAFFIYLNRLIIPFIMRFVNAC